MLYLSKSELLFWCSIGAMAGAVVLAVLLTVIFTITGQRIKKKLEEEYGRPWQ